MMILVELEGFKHLKNSNVTGLSKVEWIMWWLL